MYLDNDQFLQSLIRYRLALDAWRSHLRKHPRSRRPKPPLPDDIALTVMTIARRLATRADFAQHPFVDELVSDAVYACVRYIDRFDPARSSNPFGYFTFTCRNAFLRRIRKEARQDQLKTLALRAINGAQHVRSLEAC